MIHQYDDVATVGRVCRDFSFKGIESAAQIATVGFVVLLLLPDASKRKEAVLVESR